MSPLHLPSHCLCNPAHSRLADLLPHQYIDVQHLVQCFCQSQPWLAINRPMQLVFLLDVSFENHQNAADLSRSRMHGFASIANILQPCRAEFTLQIFKQGNRQVSTILYHADWYHPQLLLAGRMCGGIGTRHCSSHKQTGFFNE